ncbi:MAG: hypothetical protein RI922_1702 [Bacteroidota bacterium]
MMKMKQVRLIVFFLLTFCNHGKAQSTFQKIYQFQDSFSLIHDIYVTDSCYYFGATTGYGNSCDIVFGKLDLDGTLDYFQRNYSTNEYNQAYGGRTQLDTNFRGNFMFGYTNWTSIGRYPQITEVDIDGNIVNDKILFEFYNDSLDFFDLGKLIVSNEDSTYLAAFTYSDRTTDSDPSIGFDGETGVIVMKINQYGDTVWTHRFHNLQTNYPKPQYGVNEFIKSGNYYLLSLTEQSIFFDEVVGSSWSKVHFFVMDEIGNIIEHNIFQDNINTYGGFGTLILGDGSIIHGYNVSEVFGTNNQIYKYKPILSKLNSNYQQIWRDTLRESWTNLSSYSTPLEMRQINDSIFSGSYMYFHDTIYEQGNPLTSRYYQTVRIFSRHINGSTLWNRDYVYWSFTDSINEPYYDLWDFEVTNDGGFITSGTVKNYDYLNAGNAGIFGYVLKTNCLGFLDDPISEFSYSNNSGNVEFINQSVQAGSYKWIFGDGDTLETSEYIDSVTHVYSEFGTYSVILIAYGCGGQNDTISKLIDVNVFSEGYVGDGTLVTIAPNPVFSGESISIYFGDLKDGNYKLEVCDTQGKVINSELIMAGFTTHIFSLPVSAGTYFVRLMKNEKIVEVEKLIVQ